MGVQLIARASVKKSHDFNFIKLSSLITCNSFLYVTPLFTWAYIFPYSRH